jgi:hypothetical protein
VTQSENLRNKTKYSNNTSGKQGICLCTKKGYRYWKVQIKDNGKRIEKTFSVQNLGDEEAKRQAIEHRKQLEIQLGYIGD